MYAIRSYYAWKPGVSSFAASIRLPSGIEEAEYDLALWLPDDAETLQLNPLFAVRFANENVWDESTGYNVLGKVRVDSAVTGSYARSRSMQVEELLVKRSIPAAMPTRPPPASVVTGSDDLVSNPQIVITSYSIHYTKLYESG